MSKHILQAQHNEHFLSTLEDNFPTNFNDWKITIVFYIALHYIRAYAEHEGVVIGGTHKDLGRAMAATGKEIPNLDVEKDCLENYLTLYRLSRTSRYNGIVSPELHQRTQLTTLQYAKKKLIKVKNHLAAKGCPQLEIIL